MRRLATSNKPATETRPFVKDLKETFGKEIQKEAHKIWKKEELYWWRNLNFMKNLMMKKFVSKDLKIEKSLIKTSIKKTC